MEKFRLNAKERKQIEQWYSRYPEQQRIEIALSSIKRIECLSGAKLVSYIDLKTNEEIKWQIALKILGREKFFIGLSTASFHVRSIQKNNGAEVFFDFRKIFYN